MSKLELAVLTFSHLKLGNLIAIYDDNRTLRFCSGSEAGLMSRNHH